MSGCAQPALSELAFDRSVCIQLAMEAPRCEAVVKAAALVVPDVAKVDGVGMWPVESCLSPPCPTLPAGFVAYITFHYVDYRPSVAVQVRDGGYGALQASLLDAATTQALGVP